MFVKTYEGRWVNLRYVARGEIRTQSDTCVLMDAEGNVLGKVSEFEPLNCEPSIVPAAPGTVIYVVEVWEKDDAGTLDHNVTMHDVVAWRVGPEGRAAPVSPTWCPEMNTEDERVVKKMPQGGFQDDWGSVFRTVEAAASDYVKTIERRNALRKEREKNVTEPAQPL